MTGELYIYKNGAWVDCHTAYGMGLANGSLVSVLQFPKLKEPDTTDWNEQDGESPDLAAVYMESKEITLNVYFTNMDGTFGYNTFLADIIAAPVYRFKFAQLADREYDLHFVSMGGLKYADGVATCTLKFKCDYPLSRNSSTIYTYTTPSSNLDTDPYWTVDGVPLTDYGVRIANGTLTSVRTKDKVKENLSVTNAVKNGALYDSVSTIHWKARDLTLHCWMTERGINTQQGFYNNLDALLYDLTRSGTHTLGGKIQNRYGDTVTDSLFVRSFYYKSMKAEKFYYDTPRFLKFTLTLRLFANGNI